jgi:hypothetical protein
VVYFNKLTKIRQLLNNYYFGLISIISKFLPKKVREKSTEKNLRSIFFKDLHVFTTKQKINPRS